MSFIIGAALLITYMIEREIGVLIAAGLFMIAGNIGMLATNIKHLNVKVKLIENGTFVDQE